MARQLILLHGAGLGGWIWHRVMPALTVPAQAVDLPGRGPDANPGQVTLREAADHVTALVMAADEPPVLVGHSFSAQLAMLVASEQPESVRAVVLLGGMVPPSGRNFLSLMPLLPRLALGLVLRLSRRGVKLPRSAVRAEYCNDLDEITSALVEERLTREAPRLYLDAVHWGRIPAAVPVIYVKLLRDAAVSLPRQEEQIRRVKATRVETIDAGHLPMLSRPTETAELLNRVATQFT